MKKILLISTRKGLIVAEKNSNGDWQIASHHFDAIPVTFTYEDPRNGHWWVGLDHGHWGIKLHFSSDKGQNWEVIKPPSYPETAEVKPGVKASTSYIWSIHHGGIDNPDKLFIGTIPGGLFESNDRGKTWNLNLALWNHESRIDHWFGAGFDHPGIHSICVHPLDSNSIQVGVSCGGVFATTDGGKNWKGKNKGLIADFLPDKEAAYGHDPHLLVQSPSHPDVFWQQNHCGVFKSIDNNSSWQDVSQEGGPAYFGFTIAVADDNPNEAWVAPGVSDEKRVAVNYALGISKTTDGGQSWKSYTKGLPQENVYDIVYRHALAVDGDTVVFGTTTGNVFISEDRGESWHVLSNYLPMIHALTFANE